jgi:hypothetical protein
MSATTAPTDIDVIEQQLRERIEELGDRRQALALDALNSPEAREQLVDVESRLAGARAELEHVDLARVETDRRAAEASEAEAQAKRDAGLDRARELQTVRELAAKRFDKAAKALAAAADEFCTASVHQERELAAAGIRPGRHGLRVGFKPWQLEVALRTALDRRPGVLRMFGMRFPHYPMNVRRPLADLVGRPVEPK